MFTFFARSAQGQGGWVGMDMIKKALDISYVVEADIEDKVELVDNVDILDMLNKLDMIYQVAM